MGRITNILSFLRVNRNGANLNDVKVDPGGGPNITAEHYPPIGDDSYPLKTDYAYINDDSGTGRETVVGYVDPINEHKALEGDKRIYARDASTGQVIVELWLQNDGTALVINSNGSGTLSPDGSFTIVTPSSEFDVNADGSIRGNNSNGSFELETGGDFVVNGVTIASDGSVDIPASLTLNGKEIAEHGHNINSGSSAPGPTGVNN